MKSIFWKEDSRENPQSGFWQLERDRHSPLQSPLPPGLHEGFLRIEAAQCLKLRYFILSRDRFYFCKVLYIQSDKCRYPLKSAHVAWKLFEPFSETQDNCIRYGFRLGDEQEHQDFYTETESDLEDWIPVLQRVCISCGLEHDLQLCGVVGEGTFSTVRVAYDFSGTAVAVKTASKKLLLQEEETSRMHVQEIRALRKLSHPWIVKLLSVYEDEDSVHLVFEFVRGGDLFTRITKRRRYTEEKAAALFKKVLEVVGYTHSCGFVHRDIKPENILMVAPDDDCDFKLADFGLAAEVGTGSLHWQCGSPGFIAPEMLRRARYGPKVDIFSCGVLLYFLLSGKRPFNGHTHTEVMRKNREGRIYFNAEHWRGVSKDAVELVLRLTHPDPLQRLDVEAALRHPWLTRKCQMGQLRPPRITADLLIRAPEDRISHELMSRLTRHSLEDSQSLAKTSEKQANQCRVALRQEACSGFSDDTSEHGEKPAVRVAQQRSPGSLFRII